MYKSRPSNSNGVYGLTLAIVGTLLFTIIVGMISTNPPIPTTTILKIIKRTGRRSIARCQYSPFVFVSAVCSNFGASAASFAKKSPFLAVLIKL